MQERTMGFRETLSRIFRLENRAVNPYTVVTPVEIRQSSRQTLYTTVSQGIPISLQEVRVGREEPSYTGFQPNSMNTDSVSATAFMAKENHMERPQSLRVIKGVPTAIMVGMTTH